LKRKKLAVLTIETEAKDEFVSQLQELFSDYLEIAGYSIREKIKHTIDADLILISAAVATSIVKPYLPPGVENIYIDIVFSKKKVKQLNKLAPGTSAMLVDYSYSTAIDIISILYEIGIKHIDFKPVFPDIKEEDIPAVDMAVTAGLLSYVPSRATQIIDIGWRKIGVSTLMDIATKLKFLDQRLEEKLMAYAADLLPQSYGLTAALQSSSYIKNQLEVVLEVIDDGIAVIDNQNNIVHFNRNLCKILNLQAHSLENKNISQFTRDTSFRQEVFKMDVAENRLVELDKIGKKLVVTKREINVQERSFGSIFIIKDVTQIENLESQLRKQLSRSGHVAKYFFEDIIGHSPVMTECVKKAKKIASIDATVLISGETGTGKELFAQSIHNHSIRKNRPFVAINCAALPSNLLESELFGYEDGAFTGAKKGGKKGLFELAHTGTLFMDEVGDIPLDVQVKLLRVFEEKEMMRIGGTNIIPINVRILAATNREFRDLINDGKLRKDFYYRLNVLSLYIPPLRKRKSDIPYLIDYILEGIGCQSKKVNETTLSVLKGYTWEGNIRELKNCVEYMGYMGNSELTLNDLPESSYTLLPDDAEKTIFNELHDKESQIAESILKILKFRNAGRRLLYELLIKQGLETSEYGIRKILDYLQKKQLIQYGKGKKGVQLTDWGHSFIN
jgi:sigma-54 dependent transcriptional regulator, acetoin dehydrogenase operon transcriptional activator AcoR